MHGEVLLNRFSKFLLNACPVTVEHVTEVCIHVQAHFWRSHGRCALPGSPMGQLLGLP